MVMRSSSLQTKILVLTALIVFLVFAGLFLANYYRHAFLQARWGERAFRSCSSLAPEGRGRIAAIVPDPKEDVLFPSRSHVYA